jgi:DNA-binding LacI/PurR family transcriptional regulator
MAGALNMSTLKDIAREAGVSVCTISRYINNKIRVRPETADRIKVAIKKLDYIPNNAAKTLKTNSSFNIAILIPTLNNLLFAESSEVIREVVNEKGYSVFVYTFSNDIEQEKLLIPRLIENRVAGVIFNTLASNFEDFSHIDVLKTRNIPYVLINRLFDRNITPSVNADYYTGAYLATTHLFERGKKKIGIILGQKRQPQSEQNLNGYRAAIEENGFSYDASLVKECSYNHFFISDLTEELLEQGTDAVFCITDFIAVHVIEHLKKKGLAIPQDVAVVGMGNTRFCTIIEPHLTTVDIHNQEVAKTAASLLLKLISGEKADTFINMNPRLVKRDST